MRAGDFTIECDGRRDKRELEMAVGFVRRLSALTSKRDWMQADCVAWIEMLDASGYRLHVAGLPGKPDLVFAGRRKAIFVHGCF